MNFRRAMSVLVMSRLLNERSSAQLVFGVLILDVESNNAESTPVSPVDSILIYELSAKRRRATRQLQRSDWKSFAEPPMLLCLDMTRDTSYNRLSAVLFLILTFLVLLTFMDYGMSWDEVRQDTYGELVLRFYTSSFTDKRLSSHRVLQPDCLLRSLSVDLCHPYDATAV